MADPAAFQVSIQLFQNAIVVNEQSHFNGSANPPGLNSKLQKQYFTANHTLMEQMACSEIQPFNSSKTELTEAGGIFCMKWPAQQHRKSQYMEVQKYMYCIRRGVQYFTWPCKHVLVGSASTKDIWGFQDAIIPTAIPTNLILHKLTKKSHLFSTKHLSFHSFPLHTSLLSLGSCFGTSHCFLHCSGITANFHFFCVDASLFHSGLLMPIPRPPSPCSTCPMINHVLVPIVLAEPLLMGSFDTLLRG